MSYKNLPKQEKVDGFEIFRVPSLRSKKEISFIHEHLTYLISAFFFGIPVIRRAKIKLIHCHFIFPTGVLALIYKLLFGIPYVLSAHGSDVVGHNPSRFKLLHTLLKPINKIIVQNAKTVTVPSHDLKDKILAYAPNCNIMVIRNGSEDFFDKHFTKTNQITTVGRLVDYKNVDKLIQAFIKMNRSSWKLKIVGDGPEMKKLKLVSKSHPNISFTGWINHEGERFKKILNQSKIFSLLSNSESQGISVIEAMSAGCAICTTPLVAENNSLRDGITAKIVASLNLEALTKELQELTDNESLLHKLSNNGRRLFESDFMLNKITNQYHHLFQSILYEKTK